jgi:tape measure domain-containing protein
MSTENIRIVVSTSGAQAAAKDIAAIGASAEKSAKPTFDLSAAIKGLVAGAAVREIIKIADGYTEMGNRLRLVTRSADELKGVQGELFRVANDNLTSASALGETYQSLANSTKSLGLSQREVLELTEELSQATVISGASADSAANSLRQLGQGLASGALRGDEFNSVSENTPEIMRIIGASLHKNQGELRAMGAEGKITGAIIVKAFSEARTELAEKMLHTVPLVGQALTVVGNVVSRLVGEINEATGATHGLASGIIKIAREVNGLIPEMVRFVESLQNVEFFSKRAFGSLNDLLPDLRDMFGGVELMVAGLVDTISMAVRGVTILGQVLNGLPHDDFDAFMAKSGTVTQGILDAAGVRQGSTTVNAERGDPANRGLHASKAAAKVVKGGKTSEQILRDLEREYELLKLIDSSRTAQEATDEAKVQEGIFKAQSASKEKLNEQELGLIEKQLRRNNALEIEKRLQAESVERIEKALEIENALLEIENERIQREGSGKAGAAAEMAARQSAEANGLTGARALGAANGFSGTVEVMGQEQMAQMRTFGEEMAEIFGPGGTLQQGLSGVGDSIGDLVGHSIAFGDSWRETDQAVRRLGQSIIAEVIGSLIKIPIQMAINAAIGSALQATATAETVAQAGAITTAMAPAAAATSLASYGTNSVGATAAIVGVAALAAGTLIGAAAFKEGGYTGDGSIDGVAGLVHGREFVVNAQATARNRQALEAMNAGGSVGGGGGMRVTIINQAGGVEHEARQVDEGHIEIIARRVLSQHGPDVIANDMMNPHGKTGRAVVQTTTARRRRS